MVLSSALKWWEEWQLRVLVLGSLFLHWLLFFSLWVRTFHTLRRFKVVIWIAYIGGDALAIYALATLFNRHKQETPDGESTSLEVIWAPVLLIHLGGQSAISAYGLEDNELWKRHVITLVSQVTAAIYVFCKWWSGGERILQIAVLLFILGIVKFIQKPWALWSASFNSILASTNVSPPIGKKSGTYWLMLCTNSCLDIALKFSDENENLGGGEVKLSLQDYVQHAKKCTQDTVVLASDQENDFGEGVMSAIDNIYKMFVDTSAPYSQRLHDLQHFLKYDDQYTHKFSWILLYLIFLALYTRMRSSSSAIGCCLPFLLPFLPIASLVLFATSPKDGYDKSDVTVTYILFCCTVVQELVPWLINDLLNRAALKLTLDHDMVSQYSLVSFYVRKKNPTILMKLVAFGCLREYINKHWYIGQVPAALQITGLVCRHVKGGWKKYIHDVAGYKRFNNLRGQRTLRRHQQLVWSLKHPFDKSVVLWHVATELCLHCQSRTSSGQECVDGSRVISNYMMYLLFIHPEMLMPGTRPGMFDVASYELEIILNDSKVPLDNEQVLAREIMDIVKSTARGGPIAGREMARTIEEAEQPATVHTAEQNYTFTLIPAACRLAEELMELGEEMRWTVIQGVWVEMLCYSASRCRGYLHAKSLGEGREYLTTVWLLWSYLGMETLAYIIESPELQKEEEGGEDEEENQQQKQENGDGEEEQEQENQQQEQENEDGKEGASTSQFQDQADQSVEICPV